MIFYLAFLAKRMRETRHPRWNEQKKNARNGNAVLVVDFPMKKQGKKHRSMSTEWFGRQGFSWMIGCFTKIVNVNGKDHYETTKYIAIVDQTPEHGIKKQDQSMVYSIMTKMIEHYKEANDDITRLYIKSDNASNFKGPFIYYVSTFRGVGGDGREMLILELKVRRIETVQTPCDGIT